MNKKQLSVEVKKFLGVTAPEADKLVDFFFESIKENIKESGTVSITGFGAWKVKKVEEREARNPKTNEKVIVPAHNKVRFVPASQLKEFLK